MNIKEINNITWKQKNGKVIRLGQMNDKHLSNSIKMLERKSSKDKEFSKEYDDIINKMKHLLRWRKVNDILNQDDVLTRN